MQEKPIKQRAKRATRVLQFGEGNFIRAFADYIIDCSNIAGTFDSNIVIVKPIEYGTLERFIKAGQSVYCYSSWYKGRSN